jgi:hypothetical protein
VEAVIAAKGNNSILMPMILEWDIWQYISLIAFQSARTCPNPYHQST